MIYPPNESMDGSMSAYLTADSDSAYSDGSDKLDTPYKSFSHSLLGTSIEEGEEGPDLLSASNANGNHHDSEKQMLMHEHAEDYSLCDDERQDQEVGPPVHTIDTNDQQPLNTAGSLSPIGGHRNGMEIHHSSLEIHQSSSKLLFQADNMLNTAFLFIQPFANNLKTRRYVRSTILEQINPFDDGDSRIVAEYDIKAESIEHEGLVDKHYKTLAKYALGIKGGDSSTAKIPPEKFKSLFGEDLEKVIKEKRILNALEALSACVCTPTQLNDAWLEAEKIESSSSMKKIEKLDDDYYCGNLLIHNKNVYVINGFYMALKESYIRKGSSVHAYVIQWNPSSLSWCDFNSKVIGAANPKAAEAGSIRRVLYESYEDFDINTEPRTETGNGLHASLSPLEALAEQCNWLQRNVNQVDYGRCLLGHGVPKSVILDWCDNLKVKLPEMERGKKAFEVVRDLDSTPCTGRLVGLYDYELFGDNEGQDGRCSSCNCIIS